MALTSRTGNFMTDIFASDRQSQQSRFNEFFVSVQQVVLSQTPWVVYYTRPADSATTRLEIRQDLLSEWSAARYTATRLTRKSFPELVDSCKLVFKWALALEQQGMLKTVESLRSEGMTLTNTRAHLADGFVAPAWVQGLISSFTLHNDWVDLATCLSMSTDEYVDANWRRFRDWLYSVRKQQPSDREIYAFGVAVWQAYRQDVIV